MTNDYKVGQVWEDREGDRWTVDESMASDLFFRDASRLAARITWIEEHFGPLKLVEDVPDLGNTVLTWIDECTDFKVTKEQENVIKRVYSEGNGWTAKDVAVAHDVPAYFITGKGPVWDPDGPQQINWTDAYFEELTSQGYATEAPEGAPPFTNDRIFEIGIDGSLADRVVALNGGESYLADVVDTYDEALQLLVRKSADYGPRNIADSPGGPLNGLLVRSWDKMARLKNLIESGATPENESLRDTWLDMLNYSAIALMVMDGNWPGVNGD